jgi:alpha-tubulin suppressor-like RCC1 family protein
MMDHRQQFTAVAYSKNISLILHCFFLLLLLVSFPRAVSAQNIAGGNYYSMVLSNDGTVRAWGSNVSGQLGDSSIENRNVPVLVKGLTGVTAIAAEGNHSMALKSDSTVWGWGLNFYGQIGDSSTMNRNIPVKVVGLTGVIAIAAGETHSLALKKDGTVWAWGWDYFGQLGNGTGTSIAPVKIDSLSGVIAIAAGAYHSLALKNNGTIWGWGNNTLGELGIENNSPSSVPQQVSGISNVTSISGSSANSFAQKNDGTVWVWGSNTYNQVGNNTEAMSTHPRQVIGLTNVKRITGGFQHSLALKNDGTVWTWGNNSSGQLGNGGIDSNTVYEHRPTQVQGLTGIVELTGGGTHTLAVKNDGTVWAWGYNLNGQLGNGTNTEYYTLPVKVSGTWQAMTSVGKQKNLLTGFALEQNYPNPFNPTTTISYTLPASGFVVLTVYDILGRKITSLIESVQAAGEHQINFDASSLPSGVYVYRLQAGEHVSARKMILQK